MWRKRDVSCAAVCALLVALLLTQTEASSLRKTERKEATETTSIRKGIIVFGEGPNNISLDGDTASYQADSPGILNHWHQMHASLGCGQAGFMKFKAFGPLVKHFSLGQQPQSCQYNAHRTPFGYAVTIPFKGCCLVYEPPTTPSTKAQGHLPHKHIEVSLLQQHLTKV
uniref:Uncharacterized protein n=1 Tax=Knipowitschia caucasica TaxID=637954 RepID=A0AAV2JPR9_KNICA